MLHWFSAMEKGASQFFTLHTRGRTQGGQEISKNREVATWLRKFDTTKGTYSKTNSGTASGVTPRILSKGFGVYAARKSARAETALARSSASLFFR